MSAIAGSTAPNPLFDRQEKLTCVLFDVHFHVLILLALTMTGCASIERRWLYHPKPFPADQGAGATAPLEDAWFVTDDGLRLHGWFVPCPESTVTVLFSHGRDGNISQLRQPLLEFCQRHRVAVLVYDYRGFGRSEGVPSEQGLYCDARAARRWLAARTGVGEQSVVLMGRSLGAAVAVELAAKDGAGGLVIESGFMSLPALIDDHLRAPWLCKSQFDSVAKIQAYHGPILISHGEKDRVIPIEHGRRLYQAASGPKQFVEIEGAGHFDPQSDVYHRALNEFFHRVAARTRPKRRSRERSRSFPDEGEVIPVTKDLH